MIRSTVSKGVGYETDLQLFWALAPLGMTGLS
jgi:hypothetical protein